MPPRSTIPATAPPYRYAIILIAAAIHKSAVCPCLPRLQACESVFQPAIQRGDALRSSSSFSLLLLFFSSATEVPTASPARRRHTPPPCHITASATYRAVLDAHVHYGSVRHRPPMFYAEGQSISVICRKECLRQRKSAAGACHRRHRHRAAHPYATAMFFHTRRRCCLILLSRVADSSGHRWCARSSFYFDIFFRRRHFMLLSMREPFHGCFFFFFFFFFFRPVFHAW